MQNYKILTIKVSDKGFIVVPMDTEYYKNIVLPMLENDIFYEKVENYKQQKIMKSLAKSLINKRNGLYNKF